MRPGNIARTMIYTRNKEIGLQEIKQKMPCISKISQSTCRTHKTYFEAGKGGVHYHGELCYGCLWWEDNEENKAFWDELERVGMKRRPQ